MNPSIIARAVLFVLAIAYLAPAFSDETTPVALDSRAADVFAFKNGVSLVALEVDLPAESGVYQVAPLPEAALGSFWLSWPNGCEITNIKATISEIEKETSASSIPELIEANIGKTVEFFYNDATWSGKILDVPRRNDDPITPMPKDVVPAPQPPQRGDIALIELSPQNIMAIPVNEIKRVKLSDSEGYSLKRRVRENVIQFEVAKAPASKSKMVVQYLAKGLSWAPSYIIDISDENNAGMSAKAVLVNDLIPLNATHAELITGYPHIAFADQSSFLSLRPLDQLLQQVGETVEKYANKRMLSNQAFYAGAAVMAADAFAPSMPSQPVAGESEEDLFFYQLDGVTLKQGERGYFPLFTAEIPYKHLYTLEIPDSFGSIQQYNPGQQTPVQNLSVWHTLKLTNTTSSPWTTAPAMTMKNGRILGQDTIEYTPQGIEADLKITQAAAIRAEQNEYEIDRQANAMQQQRRSYDLVTVQGEVVVTNLKDEPIQLEITKTLTGELKSAEGDPEVKKLVQGLRQVNPTSRLLWKKEIQPGKENALKITYTYEVYVSL
ncbi:MAG: hypothetical protein GC154_06000 [bacterium]|nr:hypothetical protein [bacterium]